MARRIIDLRTEDQRQGITGLQKSSQIIADALLTLGRVEQTRRERQTLDRVAKAVASGASIIEAISAASQPTEFSGGLSGLLQKVGGGFAQPTGGGIMQSLQQSIIGQALKPKPLLTREEQRDVKLVGKKKRAGEGVQPFEQTKPEKARNRDIKILTDKDKEGVVKATDVQKFSARRRLRRNPSIQDRVPGVKDYTDLLKDTDKPKVKVKGAIFDKAFGEEAYKLALAEAMDQGLAEGATEASVEADFNAWWDKTAAAGSTGQPGFGVFVIPRSEFQEGVTTPESAETRTVGESIDEFLKRTSK